MAATLAVLLALAAFCHCEHDKRALGKTARRQLVEIVPVVRDGATPAAHPSSLAYILPAPHLDTEQDSSENLEELTVYADMERNAAEDREAESDREGDAEIEGRSADYELEGLRDEEHSDDKIEEGREVVEASPCAGRGGRTYLHPSYTLSFVFGR